MNKKLVVIAAALLLIIGVMLVVSSFVFGLGGTSSKSYDSVSSGLKSQNELDIQASSRDAGTSDLNEKVISFDRKIISTAHLQLEVDSVPSAVNRITNITLQQGGFISGSSVNGYERTHVHLLTEYHSHTACRIFFFFNECSGDQLLFFTNEFLDPEPFKLFLSLFKFF